jgi:hypothetical protein
MIGGAVMTSLMLPLSGDLFDLPAEAIVNNLLICAAVHESGSGTILAIRSLGRFSADDRLSFVTFVTYRDVLAWVAAIRPR